MSADGAGDWLGFLALQLLSGLADAARLFLVASGLTLIFGVTRIINFAHGTLMMLGAYLGVTLMAAIGAAAGPAAGFWIGALMAALGVGALAALMEVLLLRRLAGSHELFQLLATFALVLVAADLVRLAWGPEDLLGPRAPGLTGFIRTPWGRIPHYDLFLIALGPAVLGALWLLLHRTRWGVLLRAATADAEMLAALGVRPQRLFTGVLFLGGVLAGLAGALALPREPAHLGMDLAIVAEAFVVVVIGGLGSLAGAFLAAGLIGLVRALGIAFFPELTLVLVFALMGLVLVLRPQGLLGRPEPPAARPPLVEDRPLRPLARPRLVFALLVALGALPVLIADAATLTLASAMLVAALVAQSLHLLLGPAGQVSFGHAALSGLGAYALALTVGHAGWTPLAALALAPLAGAAGGALVAALCRHLSGVYLAMVTLAFAQILWSLAVQWVPVTGGDNGVLGLWPPPPLAEPAPWHLFVLALTALALAALRHLVHAPFGLVLRAGRDAPARARACGLAAGTQRILVFAASGATAGLAGGLAALGQGSVFPTVLEIHQSVEALVMTVLGGLGSLWGPVVGATAFTGLEALALGLPSLAGLWRLALGLIILALVLALPRGLTGLAPRRGEGG